MPKVEKSVKREDDQDFLRTVLLFGEHKKWFIETESGTGILIKRQTRANVNGIIKVT